MPKAKSAKAAGSEAFKGLNAIFDRLSKRAGGTGNAKSKAAAERTKDTEDLAEAFQNIRNVYSSVFLDHLPEVTSILKLLENNIGLCTAVPSLGDSVNRTIADILDCLNMSLSNATPTQVLTLNEIVETSIKLMLKMIEDGSLGKELCGPVTFQKLFRVVLNGGKYKTKNKRLALDLITDLTTKCAPNHDYLCGFNAESFMKKCVRRLHDLGDYQLQATFLEILRTVVQKKHGGEREGFLAKVFEQEEARLESFEKLGRNEKLRDFLIDFNKDADGINKFPKIVPVSSIIYQNNAIGLPEGGDTLYFEINADSFSCDGNVQSADDETVDAVVVVSFNDIKDWQIERIEDDAARLTIKSETKQGRVTTKHVMSIEVSGPDAEWFAKTVGGMLGKRRVHTSNQMPEGWEPEEGGNRLLPTSRLSPVRQESKKQPKTASSKKKSIANNRIRLMPKGAALPETIQDDSGPGEMQLELPPVLPVRKTIVSPLPISNGSDAYDLPLDDVDEPAKKTADRSRSSHVLAPDSGGAEVKVKKETVYGRNKKRKAPTPEIDEESEISKVAPRRNTSRKMRKPSPADDDDEESEEEYKPAAGKKGKAAAKAPAKAPATKPKGAKGKAAAKDEEEEELEVPAPRSTRRPPTARKPPANRSKTESEDEEEEAAPAPRSTRKQPVVRKAPAGRARTESVEKAVEEAAADPQSTWQQPVVRKAPGNRLPSSPSPSPPPAAKPAPAIPKDKKIELPKPIVQPESGSIDEEDDEVKRQRVRQAVQEAHLRSSAKKDSSVFPMGDIGSSTIVEKRGKSAIAAAVVEKSVSWKPRRVNDERLREMTDEDEQVDLDLDVGIISPTLESQKGNMSAQVSVAAMVNFTENGKSGVTSALMIPGGTKKISKASMAKLRAMVPGLLDSRSPSPEMSENRFEEILEEDAEMRDADEEEEPPSTQDFGLNKRASNPPARNQAAETQEESDSEEEEDEEDVNDITLINIMARIGNPALAFEANDNEEPASPAEEGDLEIDETMLALFNRLGEVVARRMAMKQRTAQGAVDTANGKMKRGVEKFLSGTLASRINMVRNYLAEAEKRSKELVAAATQIKSAPRKDLDDALDASNAFHKRRQAASTRKGPKGKKATSLMD